MKYKLYRWDQNRKRYSLETYNEFDDKIRAYEFARDSHQEDGEPLSYQEKWKVENEKETIEFYTNIEMRMEFIKSEEI